MVADRLAGVPLSLIDLEEETHQTRAVFLAAVKSVDSTHYRAKNTVNFTILISQ